jgi:hypothetical protein
VIRVYALSMCLNALLIMECPLEAMLVTRVHLDALLAGVHVSHAKRSGRRAYSARSLSRPSRLARFVVEVPSTTITVDDSAQNAGAVPPLRPQRQPKL